MKYLLALGLVVAGVGSASADAGIRTFGASARTIGCTRWAGAMPCDGASSLRFGLSAIDVMWRTRGGSGPIAMVDLSGRPEDAQINSQMIAAFGWRQRIGRLWLQAGPGIGIARKADRTIRSTWLLEGDGALAMVAGAGYALELANVPFDVSLDVAASLEDNDLYQITASVTTTRF
ncbi:MAG: hypothetical protein ABI867_21580 [Kofleriaceae bacterium]